MAELGDLDLLMNDIIVTVHGLDDQKKDFITKKMKTRVEQQSKSLIKTVEKFDELTIQEIVEGFLNSSKRLNTMMSIATELELAGYSDRLKAFEQTSRGGTALKICYLNYLPYMR